MAAAYVDSSCVVAVALAEPGARQVAIAIRRYERCFAANLLEAEVQAALARERAVMPPGLLDGLEWVLPTRALHEEIERVSRAGALRGADLWHVACALYLDPTAADLAFVTLDAAQRKVAAAVGFATPH